MAEVNILSVEGRLMVNNELHQTTSPILTRRPANIPANICDHLGSPGQLLATRSC